MTINTTNITSGPYVGNGIADTFNYTFRIYNKTQLAVFETTDLGVETELTVDTDYTVNTIGTSGTITRVAGALPTGYQWYVRADYKQTQLTAFSSQGPFLPEIHEEAMDKLTMLVQQITDKLGRTLSLSDTYAGVLPMLIDNPVSNMFLRWKSDLSGMENFDMISYVDSLATELGWDIIGDFADTPIVTDTNSVLSSKAVIGYEDALWRTNQVLPYTPTGTDPTQAPELGKWVAVAVGELQTIARSLNAIDSEVIYSNDTTTVLDDVSYIYDRSSQINYIKPTLDGPEEYIVTVVGDQLTTAENTYTMAAVDIETDSAGVTASIATNAAESVSVFNPLRSYSAKERCLDGFDVYIAKSAVAISTALPSVTPANWVKVGETVLLAEGNYPTAVVASWPVAEKTEDYDAIRFCATVFNTRFETTVRVPPGGVFSYNVLVSQLTANGSILKWAKVTATTITNTGFTPVTDGVDYTHELNAVYGVKY